MTTPNEIRWTRGSRFGVDPEVAFAELEKIKQKGGGDLTADAVVRAAKSKRNPLHDEFEWDDAVAGHKFRCIRARTMIASVQVRYSEAPDVPTRQYNVVVAESHEAEKPPKKVYRSTSDILQDPELRAQLLADAFGQLRSFQTRFRGLQELAPVFRGIAEALESA